MYEYPEGPPLQPAPPTPLRGSTHLEEPGKQTPTHFCLTREDSEYAYGPAYANDSEIGYMSPQNMSVGYYIHRI